MGMDFIMRALLPKSCRLLPGPHGFILALILTQFGAASVAHATNSCLSSAAVNPGMNAQSCQWHFANPGGIVGGGDSGNAYGTGLYGGKAAPAPSQSAGIRQDKGVTSIMYNGYANDCRFVDNVGGTDLFVPQNTAKEFEAFVDRFTSAPQSGVVFGYCTQGLIYPYTPKASMPNNFQIFGGGDFNAEIDPQPLTYATSLTRLMINVPTMRVPMPFVYPVAPTPPITLGYFRQDCRIDAAQVTVCNQRPITETQIFTWASFANPSPKCPGTTVHNVGYGTGLIDSNTNCDGQWLTPTLTSTYAVGNDATQWSDPYEDFLPPGMESCERGDYSSGVTWLQTTTSAPTTQACPAGEIGTQSCTASYVTTETCNDGLIIVGNPGPSSTTCNAAGCVAVPSIAPCTTNQGTTSNGTTQNPCLHQPKD
jgi:hypothetical protein